MKKLLSLTLALVMAMALAVPAFAADTPPSAPTDVIDTDDGIMPLIRLFDDTASSRNGQWTSSEFTATPTSGNYIRIWHQNDTNEKVKVYLYRTESGRDKVALLIYVDANDQASGIYHSSDASSGTYKIVIEAYVSGGSVSGDVAAAQYRTDPRN